MYLDNVVIKALTPEHEAKIIEFFKSNTVNVENYIGGSSESTGGPSIYYGVINGKFSNYILGEVRRANARIITLPENPLIVWPEARFMMVSDSKLFNEECIRLVFGTKGDRFLAWSDVKSIKEAENEYSVTTWKYAKDIPQTNSNKVTPLQATIDHIKPAIAPPIGIIPKKLYIEQVKKERLEALRGAISRYYTAGLKIDPEWIDEYNALIVDIDKYQEDNKQ